eukprot:CAMPEP_0117490912 /NCGR_PEP_ID=MMETSP0784-20121206/17792_1 /TAXON_ID=39447 /ORGANISM="" /LENGTH=82 /DNA_ID=CAMNT_0005285679 /DNA_START=30 /DNA_END=278 /DNA_ORIENTATION=-
MGATDATAFAAMVSLTGAPWWRRQNCCRASCRNGKKPRGLIVQFGATEHSATREHTISRRGLVRIKRVEKCGKHAPTSDQEE